MFLIKAEWPPFLLPFIAPSPQLSHDPPTTLPCLPTLRLIASLPSVIIVTYICIRVHTSVSTTCCVRFCCLCVFSRSDNSNGLIPQSGSFFSSQQLPVVLGLGVGRTPCSFPLHVSMSITIAIVRVLLMPPFVGESVSTADLPRFWLLQSFCPSSVIHIYTYPGS